MFAAGAVPGLMALAFNFAAVQWIGWRDAAHMPVGEPHTGTGRPVAASREPIGSPPALIQLMVRPARRMDHASPPTPEAAPCPR